MDKTILGVTDADETGLSFIENAIIKARHASRISKQPALADDLRFEHYFVAHQLVVFLYFVLLTLAHRCFFV